MHYHLLIDADDTLWENNIYFEQAIHAFIEFLDHSNLTPAEGRGAILNALPLCRPANLFLTKGEVYACKVKVTTLSESLAENEQMD